jgi:hypothetical protein
MGNKSLALLRQAFRVVRNGEPEQPPTAAIWDKSPKSITEMIQTRCAEGCKKHKVPHSQFFSQEKATEKTDKGAKTSRQDRYLSPGERTFFFKIIRYKVSPFLDLQRPIELFNPTRSLL